MQVSHVVGFAEVAAILNQFANVGSYLLEQFEEFVRSQGLDDVTHVIAATHSMGNREWDLVPGRPTPTFFPETLFSGGWYLLREEDVQRLCWTSAASGSTIEAIRQSDGSWVVTLEVPEEDGAPYKGGYWEAFHKAA